MLLSNEIVKGIKTFGGGLYHCLSNYPKRELHNDANFAGILWALKLDKNTVIYSVELTPGGFIIYTKDVVFRYHHDDWRWEDRIIELKF